MATMTYERASLILQAYMRWIENTDAPAKRCPRPTNEDLNAALSLCVRLLGQVIRGELPTAPAQLRQEALEEAIAQFIYENRKS